MDLSLFKTGGEKEYVINKNEIISKLVMVWLERNIDYFPCLVFSLEF